MQRLHRHYTAAWAVWAVSFVAIEACALRHDEGGTLSEHMRAALGQRYDSHPAHRVLGMAAIALTLSWLVPHVVHDTHLPVKP